MKSKVSIDQCLRCRTGALLVDSGLNLVEAKGATDPSGLFAKLSQCNSSLRNWNL